MGYTTSKRGKRVLHFEAADADAVLAAYRASRPLGSQTPAGLATFAGSEHKANGRETGTAGSRSSAPAARPLVNTSEASTKK